MAKKRDKYGGGGANRGRGGFNRGGGSGGWRQQVRPFGGAGAGRGGGRGRGGFGGSGRSGATTGHYNNGDRAPDADRQQAESLARQAAEDALDEAMGYPRIKDGPMRTGWLINIQNTTVTDQETGLQLAAVDLYFLNSFGETYKVSKVYEPYFYLAVRATYVSEVDNMLKRMYEETYGLKIKPVEKEDLDLQNHLSGLKRVYLKLSFNNVNDLLAVRKEVLPIVLKNKAKMKTNAAYGAYDEQVDDAGAAVRMQDYLECLTDIREYDVPYYVRCCIDLNLFCASWYDVSFVAGQPNIVARPDLKARPECRVIAFDIETTKAPLKFPDPTTGDQIMMVSYMYNGQGYLIVNREVVAEDVENFEYSPTEEFRGEFEVSNVPDELALLNHFFDHIRRIRPNIFVTYNGDFFDWNFIDIRAQAHGMKMGNEIGVNRNTSNEFLSRYAPHMDAFYWVKRDSYLPQGSQGLKSVTKAKLKYNPLELDPEEMTPFATSRVQELASYSVSDAVATYYLYMKYVHPFVFSLCTIIPLKPDEVLRKGSGTLCESLLMVKAYEAHVVFPNKQEQEYNQLYKGHLLDSETYVGGHVEALQSGVFRDDLPVKFKLQPEAFDDLIASLDDTLEYTAHHLGHVTKEDIVNYDEVKGAIQAALEDLRSTRQREETPLIYHLDVAAMYPNIILTNRLQPTAMVDEATCAACDFNRPESDCKRPMEWIWRGTHLPNTRADFELIRNQLSSEVMQDENEQMKRFDQLSAAAQANMIKSRLTGYCRKVYKKTSVTEEEQRVSTVCMRENPFYIDMVRAFRDRRYEYKGLHKVWKDKLAAGMKEGASASEIQDLENMCVLYDSLQLAHKCILNSFYGYVMRRGARWFSMEMAGIVTYTGANIIMNTRELIEKIGKPLELDTDGVWCLLPKSFPENFDFKTKAGKKIGFNYSCVVLNKMVADKYTNPQYQNLQDPETLEYKKTSECSIEFEVDGPYKAMILPASQEEDKKLKKRYAVFHLNGKLAELKGFELKRRGELKIIKLFQEQVFESFLRGKTLEECYAAVGTIADRYLDILESHGQNMPDEELFDYVSEARSMSRQLSEYEGQKSTSITTAKRLAEFLGDQMVKDAGLACKYVVSKKPIGAPVTERAVPVAIFQADEAVKRSFLRKWCKDASMVDFSIRSVLDWDYYITRLAGTIQKIVTIPAALQKVDNPVPRVKHPDWLGARIRANDDTMKQTKIKDMFRVVPKPAEMEGVVPTSALMDIENIGQSNMGAKPAVVHKRKRPLFDVDGTEENEQETSPVRADAISDVTARVSPEDESPECPSRSEDLQAWMEFHKKKWKKMRERRKMKVDERGMRGLNNMGKYLKQQSLSVRGNYWEIVQIIPSGTPGEFKVWAVVGQRLQAITIVVPRVFYLNMRVKDAKPSPFCKQVSRQLPHSRQAQFLYEFSLTEEQYLANYSTLSSFFSHPDVEGVYGNQVPLDFSAIVQLGCVAQVAPGMSGRNSIGKYHLNDLTRRNTAECPYLEGNVCRKILLYQSCPDKNFGPGSHCFITLVDLTSGTALAIVHNLADAVSMPSLDRLATEALNEGRNVPEKADVVAAMPTLTFTVSRASTPNQAYNQVKRYLSQLPKAPTMVLAMTAMTVDAFKAAVPALNDYPVISLPIHSNDNAFPVLSWERFVAKRMTTRLIEMQVLWGHHLEFCRYAHVPVGNVNADLHTQFTDVFLARHLLEQQHVLWASETDRPDLGGAERDEAVQEELEPMQVLNEGCYPQFSIEVALEELAVNTVIHSSYINEIEGETQMGYDFAASTIDASMNGNVRRNGGDDTMACMESFRMVKTLVTTWATDVGHTDNPFAESLMNSFYRWLQSRKSLFYDPALNRLVHLMMQKVFKQLIADIKQQNARVVYADYGKMIIATNKSSLEQAITFAQYLVHAIGQKELFSQIGLKPVRFRECLFFLDASNYGAMLHDYDAGSDQWVETTENCWGIKRYLPRPLHLTMDSYIGGFVAFMRRSMQDVRAAHTGGHAAPGSEMGAVNANLIAYLRGDLSNRLFNVVSEVLKSQVSDDWAFPQLPGSHLELHNPALEFVKQITKILSLHHDIEESVGILRMNLLRLIGVREFSTEAQFQHPAASLLLPSFMCANCNDRTRLDMCRDPALLDGNFDCTACQSRLDVDKIERSLVDKLHTLSLEYQMQDLRCIKCRQVKDTNLSPACACAGRFQCLHPRDEFMATVKTFANVAAFYQLEWLQEEAGWLMEQA